MLMSVQAIMSATRMRNVATLEVVMSVRALQDMKETDVDVGVSL